MIEAEGLSADLLLCPGDLGDKASIEGIKYAWQAVHRIGNKLKCQLVAGTAGNHDLDSRGIKTPPDPKEVLQALAPPFPLPDQTKNDQYWSRQYAIITTDVFRLVVLNSSGFHGTQIKEIEHGRISDSTLNWLQEELATGSPQPINLLLCHHHPQSLSELKLGEKDVMQNGQLLLDLLGSGDHGRWLVIHGHKHYPKLT